MGVRRYGIYLRSHSWQIKLSTKRQLLYIQTPIYYFVYFINTNVQSEMRISHLESFFCLALLSKKFVVLAENERLANKMRSTNRHRDTNYKTLDLIDLIKYSLGFSLDRWSHVKILFLLRYYFTQWPKTLYHTKVYEKKCFPLLSSTYGLICP